MLTLEINNTEIRVMEISGNTIVKWASHLLEPGMFEEETVIDPQTLGTIIKQVLTSNGIRENKVISSVSSLYSLSRIIHVPGPSEQTVSSQSVLNIAEEVMPLSEEDMYFLWQVVAPAEDGQQVFITGIPKDILDSEVLMLKAIGLNPRILDLKTLALARAVNRENALILNINNTSFDIIIIHDGIPEVLRSSSWQTEDFSMEEKIEHLTTALKLTVDFHDSHHPGFPLVSSTPFFITGQLSGDMTLVEQLQEGVEYPFILITPPLEYPEHFPVSQYAVNIGLALKALADGTTPKINFSIRPKETTQDTLDNTSSLPDINFLPQVYKPWRPSVKQVYSTLGIIIIIGLIFPLYQVTTEAMRKTSDLEIRYNAVNYLLDMRKTELARREPLQQTIDQYKSIVDMGGGAVEDLEVIRNLANELEIDMTSISHTGETVSFTCQAPDYIIFRSFLNAIEESGRFASVSRPSEFFPYPTGGVITIEISPKNGG